MVNTAEFSKRLNKILDYYDLSAASFADQIEVGRSSISHILSGRNKPSLDFVMKIIKTFPEVELYWLLNGKGEFPQENKKEEAAPTPNKENTTPARDEKFEQHTQPENNFQTNLNNSKNKGIRKIVIFYEDGSFEAFEN